MLVEKCETCGREKRIVSAKIGGVKICYTKKKKDKEHICCFVPHKQILTGVKGYWVYPAQTDKGKFAVCFGGKVVQVFNNLIDAQLFEDACIKKNNL